MSLFICRGNEAFLLLVCSFWEFHGPEVADWQEELALLQSIILSLYNLLYLMCPKSPFISWQSRHPFMRLLCIIIPALEAKAVRSTEIGSQTIPPKDLWLLLKWEGEQYFYWVVPGKWQIKSVTCCCAQLS